MQFEPFTPKSDQFQICPAASPKISSHKVWKTCFSKLTQLKDHLLPILTTSHISLFKKVGRMYFLNLEIKGIISVNKPWTNPAPYLWMLKARPLEWIPFYGLLCRLLTNPFTPKSDQFQISPTASPEILYHIVCRTWLFVAYSDKRLYWSTNSHYPTYSVHFSSKGLEKVLYKNHQLRRR